MLSALINALVLSQVRYCISVYDNGKKRNFHRLQKIINYAAEVVPRRRKMITDRVSDLLDWDDSARGMARHHTLCPMHKVRRSGEPEQLAEGSPLWRRPERLSG